MRVIKNIDTKYLVSIDIETVRLDDKFDEVPELFQNAWEYKNKQAGEVPDQEELHDLWMKQGSLYAEFSKICAVSMAFMDKDGEVLFCKGLADTDERKLLSDLTLFLNRILMGNTLYRLVGHASFYFDFPFLSKRYIINGMDIPKILDETDKKPWEKANLDTNVLWKCGGTGPGSSLQALCVVLDIPISKVDMVGDQVGREYFAGNLEGIRDYCNKDAVATFNVMRRLKGEEIFQYEDVIYLDNNDEDENAEPVPALMRLMHSGEFTEDIKEELREKIESGDFKDEGANIAEIICAHYQAKGDKVAIKKKKADEVAEFVNSLNIG
jgi:hypothetical protein